MWDFSKKFEFLAGASHVHAAAIRARTCQDKLGKTIACAWLRAGSWANLAHTHAHTHTRNDRKYDEKCPFRAESNGF